MRNKDLESFDATMEFALRPVFRSLPGGLICAVAISACSSADSAPLEDVALGRQEAALRASRVVDPALLSVEQVEVPEVGRSVVSSVEAARMERVPLERTTQLAVVEQPVVVIGATRVEPTSIQRGATAMVNEGVESVEPLPLTVGSLETSGYEVRGCDPGLVWVPPAAGQKTRTECTYDRFLRPARPLSECPDAERNGALCYPRCDPGYSGYVTRCMEDCPEGYVTLAETCLRNADTQPLDTSQCPSYDICGTWHDCEGECPAGYSKTPCTCYQGPDSFGRSFYDRGAGWSMSCPKGTQQLGALCYDDCPAGYRNDGVMCTALQQTCRQVPIASQPDPVRQYCFKVTDSDAWTNPCHAFHTLADTLDHALELAEQCNCPDGSCDITPLQNCDYLDEVCR